MHPLEKRGAREVQAPGWGLKGVAIGLLAASGVAIWWAANHRADEEGERLVVEDAKLAQVDEAARIDEALMNGTTVEEEAAAQGNQDDTRDGASDDTRGDADQPGPNPSPDMKRWSNNAVRMRLARSHKWMTSGDPRGRARCQANAELIYDQMQKARIGDDHDETLRIVDLALEQPCMEARTKVLYRVGVLAACQAQQPIRAQAYYRMASDPSLVAACPEYLATISVP